MKIGYLMQTSAAPVRTQPNDGPSVHVRQVFRELKNLGHDVTLVANLENQTYKSNDLETYQPVSTPWLQQGPLRWLERLLRRVQSTLHLPYIGLFESVRFGILCVRLLPKCDLFYERMGWMGYGGMLAALWLGIPLLLEVNGDFQAEFGMLGVASHGIQQWLELRLMQFLVRHTAHVVTAGEGWRQSFIARWQIDPQRVTSVENGSEVVNLLERHQLRAFDPTTSPEESVTLVYLGGFHPWQGVQNLLLAFTGALCRGANLRLVLIGAGAQMATYEQMARDLCIDAQVTFTGRLRAQEYASYLAQADIGVSAYCGRTEYSGLKLFDYKAAGLAIIASGANGEPAVLEHGRTGWIVPPCDVNALLEAILLLSSNPELRKSLGQAARIDAENRHGWQHTTRELEKIFMNVIEKSRQAHDDTLSKRQYRYS
jgi:glycosyltransferase involved in cell wall biosynthesis